MWQMPYGYLQFDSPSFLYTGAEWLRHHVVRLPSKRSFLTPVTFALPLILPVRSLVVIPAAQHLLGLLQIIFAGALVRLWFARWKWFIVPVTLLLAASPWILWFEHALMAETQFLFFLFASALAGSLWVRERTPANFFVLLLALICTAGTRGEGRFLFLFGLILVPLILWNNRRAMTLGLLCVGIPAALLQLVGRDFSAATYLYASVIQFTPDRIPFEPDLETSIIPLRDRFRAEWTQYPADTVRTAKLVGKTMRTYIKAKMPGKRSQEQHKAGSRILKRLSFLALCNAPWRVIQLPLTKTKLAIDSWSSGGFDARFLYRKQLSPFGSRTMLAVSERFVGVKLAKDQLPGFLESHYSSDRLRWFTRYQHAWHTATIWLRLPDRPAPQRRWVHDIIDPVPGGQNVLPGVPLFYILAVAGMAAAMLRPAPHRRTQIAWVVAMVATWYLAAMIGNATPRYRFGYEPFCMLYFFQLFDCLFAGALALRRPPAAERSSR